MQRRVRTGVIAVAVAASLAVLAVWASGLPAIAPHRAATQTTYRAQSADDVASAKAKRLLSTAVLPAGARSVSASSVSDIPGQLGPTCSPKVILTRYVKAPLTTPGAFRDYVAQHVEVGLVIGDAGMMTVRGANASFVVRQSDTVSNQLYFTIVPSPDGGAVVRIDAIVLEPQGACTFAAANGRPSPWSHTVTPSEVQAAITATTFRAQQVLDTAVLPIGARGASDLTSPVFAAPAVFPECEPSIDLTRFVVVTGHTLSGLKSYFAHHLSPGLQFTGSGEEKSDRTRKALESDISQGDNLGTQLVFTMAPAEGGKIGIRIDAIAIPSYSNCQSTQFFSGAVRSA